MPPDQACYKPFILTSFIRLIKTEFNNILQQVFESALPVRWPKLENLTHIFTMRNFRPDSIIMPGGFQKKTRLQTQHQGTGYIQHCIQGY